jgi:phosphoglycerol transferase
VYDAFRQIKDRRIYNRFISEVPPQKNTEEVVPFDLYPSILEFIGFTAPGERLGLGYSAFGAAQVERPKDRLRELVLPSLSGSSRYERLWEAQ